MIFICKAFQGNVRIKDGYNHRIVLLGFGDS